MKKSSLLFFMQIIICCSVFAQNGTPVTPRTTTPSSTPTTTPPDTPPATTPNTTPGTTPATNCTLETYKGQLYIFNGNMKLNPCDAVGDNDSTTPPIIIYKGSVFEVVGLLANCNLIIKFRPFKPLSKKLTYNISQTDNPQTQKQIQSQVLNGDQQKRAKAKITNDDAQYFILNQSDFIGTCSPFSPKDNFSITLGTFTTPFKFRPTKSIFTNNLSLGAAAYFNWDLGASNSIGFVVGISATSVTLDSFSTKGTVSTDTERPALTPSLSFVYTYKMINFTLGSGIDYVNKTSDLEKSWIFNGKPWIGFGIGVSLFSASSPAPATLQDSSQK